MQRTTTECTKCNKEISLSNFNKHFNSCTGPIKQNLKCDCGKNFETTKSLRSHKGHCKNNDRIYKIWNKGLTKKEDSRVEFKGMKIPLKEILEGLHPTYQRIHLKKRLLDEGIKKNECELCGTSEWNGKKLTCQLDHKNGKPKDHRLENLRMLCPNCHSQTPTFAGKTRH